MLIDFFDELTYAYIFAPHESGNLVIWSISSAMFFRLLDVCVLAFQVLMGLRHCWVRRVQIWAVKSRFYLSVNHNSRPPQLQKSLRQMLILKLCWNLKQTYTHYCRDAVRHTPRTCAVVQTDKNVKVSTRLLCSLIRW